ncbi:MAG: hypothetical protein ACR2IV_21715 [Bryobacteraceae bacterium]
MFHSFAGQRLTLTIGERLTASTAVGVEYDDVLFVGEVISCTPGAGDQWTIDIEVAHTLTGIESLMRLRAQLDECQAPIRPAFALVAKKSPVPIDQPRKGPRQLKRVESTSF